MQEVLKHEDEALRSPPTLHPPAAPPSPPHALLNSQVAFSSSSSSSTYLLWVLAKAQLMSVPAFMQPGDGLQLDRMQCEERELEARVVRRERG